MLKKINFNNNFVADNLKDAVKITEEEFEGNIWYVEEMDMSHPVFSSVKELNGNKDIQKMLLTREIEPGIYETIGHNFNHSVSFFSDHEVIDNYQMINRRTGLSFDDRNMTIKDIDWENCVNPYGVADNIKQIKDYFKCLEESAQEFIISVTEIRKEEQSSEGGWRWHKWGKYIGVQNPQYEYIYDEPEIQKVYCFHVYQVKVKPEFEEKLTQPKKLRI